MVKNMSKNVVTDKKRCCHFLRSDEFTLSFSWRKGSCVQKVRQLKANLLHLYGIIFVVYSTRLFFFSLPLKDTRG